MCLSYDVLRIFSANHVLVCHCYVCSWLLSLYVNASLDLLVKLSFVNVRTMRVQRCL